jgi:hypothetical protein
MSRYVGITVLCDYVISEGVDAVLANLLKLGASAVAVNPTVTTEAAEGEAGASWQPPSDGGTSPRLFDRPLFGKRSLWVRSGSSYNPRAELYEGCAYQPKAPNDLTAKHGHVISEFIQRALDAGLEVYLQVGGCGGLGFPGLRDEDRPHMPDGTVTWDGWRTLPRSRPPLSGNTTLRTPRTCCSNTPGSPASASTGPSTLAIPGRKSLQTLTRMWQRGRRSMALTLRRFVLMSPLWRNISPLR